MEILTYKKVY
jgi:hypothetical protein